ncbi:DedA family protein [Bacillaceae bacterium SIJ1]|uniref:YqaA family protein n=1 Tax=Litoribacterium kuwaitense TaxID=1398745 RepID=UPI0013EA30F5|nr:VTT domain-containing protein [Litoribacterium kuwaitense]NGP46290.1 DedA family protein [Litoribacterium kuwaitense]
MFQAFLDFLMEFGIWGLIVHSFLDAVIFPIPAFFTQVSLSILNPSQALWLATAGYIACLIGTPFGYWIGRGLGKGVLEKILKKKWIVQANHMFRKNGEAAVMIGAFTPIPFKVFTILSGFLKFPLWKLIVFAAVGRAVKFYAVGTLFFMYGQTAEHMVKDVSLYIFIIAVPVLLVGLVIKRKLAKKLVHSDKETNQIQVEKD